MFALPFTGRGGAQIDRLDRDILMVVCKEAESSARKRD
jgi:hypothetical protein